MTAVWKFPISMPRHDGRVFIELPNEALIVSAGIQGDDLVVWAVTHGESASTHRHRLIVVNTGTEFDLPDDARFIGTVTHAASGVVWHVFDGDAS